MGQVVEQALKQAKFITDNDIYRLVQLPSSAITLAAGIVAEVGEAFNALIVDRHEVSLILQSEALEDFAPRLRDGLVNPVLYRLITIDVVLEPDLVGFLALVTSALASEGIPILAFSAYSRDHLFVPDSQINVAVAALTHLQAKL